MDLQVSFFLYSDCSSTVENEYTTSTAIPSTASTTKLTTTPTTTTIATTEPTTSKLTKKATTSINWEPSTASTTKMNSHSASVALLTTPGSTETTTTLITTSTSISTQPHCKYYINSFVCQHPSSKRKINSSDLFLMQLLFKVIKVQREFRSCISMFHGSVPTKQMARRCGPYTNHTLTSNVSLIRNMACQCSIRLSGMSTMPL